jgi:hypothetical protein
VWRKCSAIRAMWNWLMAAFCSADWARQSSGAVRSDSSSAFAGDVLRKTEGTAGALAFGKPREVLQCVT